jgi:hypothetical protein
MYTWSLSHTYSSSAPHSLALAAVRKYSGFYALPFTGDLKQTRHVGDSHPDDSNARNLSQIWTASLKYYNAALSMGMITIIYSSKIPKAATTAPRSTQYDEADLRPLPLVIVTGPDSGCWLYTFNVLITQVAFCDLKLNS